MTQPSPTTIPWTASLYAHRTYGVLDNPQNQPVATFNYNVPNEEGVWGLPPTVSWDGRIFQREDTPGYGPIRIVYYELRPVAVEAKPFAGV
jgi:hypothetical protein